MSEKCAECNGKGEMYLLGAIHPAVCHRCLGSGLNRLPNPFTMPAQSGWSCPRCSRIYGPSVQICVPCNTAVAVKESK